MGMAVSGSQGTDIETVRAIVNRQICKPRMVTAPNGRLAHIHQGLP
jgi:hypothetical protein